MSSASEDQPPRYESEENKASKSPTEGATRPKQVSRIRRMLREEEREEVRLQYISARTAGAKVAEMVLETQRWVEMINSELRFQLFAHGEMTQLIFGEIQQQLTLDQKNRELGLKERELTLRERELALRERELAREDEDETPASGFVSYAEMQRPDFPFTISASQVLGLSETE